MINLVYAELPSLPDALAARRPLIVGAGARLLHGGGALHEPPEVWVDEVESVPGVVVDPTRAGRYRLGAWRLRARPDALKDTLAARTIALDAFGVEANGDVVDPLGGVAAFKAQRLDPLPDGVSDLDAALLVRLPALACELGVRLEQEAFDSVKSQSGGVFKSDRDALREALTRLLVGRRPSGGLSVLSGTGLLELVLPEVAALIDFHRSSRHHHKDVWAHTKQVVMQAVPRSEIRWAALLHDVGKTHTRSYAPGKKVHFFRHDDLGAYMFEGVAARLRFPEVLSERVRLLIQYHLRANLYSQSWSDAAIRRFDGEIGPVLNDLLALSRADVTSKRTGRRREAMRNLFHLKTRIAEVQALDAARQHSVPKGLGTEIIQRLGVAPGPRIGQLRQACEDAIREGRLPASPDVDTCIEFLRAQVAA